MSGVASSRYGKDNVRVFRRFRDEKTGEDTRAPVEMTVCVLLEGDIETSYTEGDNSVVVATDSIKNTIYIKAKESTATPPEVFASFLGSHFISTYSHIHKAHIKVVATEWRPMVIDGAPHPHSFEKAGTHVRTAEVTVGRQEGIAITSGLSNLLVLKTTGSAFHGFVRDEYTTLPETNDRILSTEMDLAWAWAPYASGHASVEAEAARFDAAYAKAYAIAVKTFATDNSASVQNTMHKIAVQVLEAEPSVNQVALSLPNKHYFEINLSWHKGIKNTGQDAEVYAPQTDPNGLIKYLLPRSKLVQ